MSVSLIQALPWTASLLALAGSAAADLRARIIPDEFSILIALCGVALALRSGAGQLGASVLAAFGVFVVLGVFAHYNAIGGGDVKLIAATSLLVPPDCIPASFDRNRARGRRAELPLPCGRLFAPAPGRHSIARPLVPLRRANSANGCAAKENVPQSDFRCPTHLLCSAGSSSTS